MPDLKREEMTSWKSNERPNHRPFDLEIWVPCRGDDLEIVAVLVEKVVFGEEFRPVRSSHNDLVDDVGTFDDVDG